jgi:hypothetical protein
VTGLTPDPEHVGLLRTLFDDPVKKQFYDQIARFTGTNGTPALTPPLAYEGPVGTSTSGPTPEDAVERCREARGDDSLCSCAGTQPGIAYLGPREIVVGETTVVDTTIWRWRRVVCRDALATQAD